MSSEWLEVQKLSYERPEIIKYFKNLLLKAGLGEIKDIENLNILELGAGSGQIPKLLGNQQILRQDITFTNNIDLQSDLYKLPIKNLSMDIIFVIDVFHHLGRPWEFFNESFRVLKNGGKLILIEPYRSFFSFLIYKIFHHEPILMSKKYEFGIPLLNEDPSSANNGIPTDIFLCRQNINYLNKLIKDKYIFEETIIFSDFLSFFATGGLNRGKSIIRNRGFDFLLKIEDILSQRTLRIIGSRMIIKLKKQ